MRNSTVFILIVVAVVAMAFGGWISFNDSGEKASVTIHKEKIKQDTESAVEQGEKLVNKATSKSKELIDQGDQGEPASENASATEETEPATSP
ncbi:hypothetical protein V6x_15590 [Gimesia chilikensis]|uniref:Uncharacterized protein n=1 Tax=Gimesia chilikensis TaxID=2605989 RepID=A0A517W9D8_9PLAN|nr:hypothetical protein [Gimesia chilikensis]QDU01876.1 hypothetical protein V6x_15590 [Gimesia chilikensis]